jgi:hypothetical protein
MRGQCARGLLAALAMGTRRRKVPELEWALTGQFTKHHGRLMPGELELMAFSQKIRTSLFSGNYEPPMIRPSTCLPSRQRPYSRIS